MNTVHLLFAYALFFIVGVVVGALQHKKVLTGIERICAIVKEWYMD